MNRVALLLLAAGIVLGGCRRAGRTEAAPPPGEHWLTDSQLKGGGIEVAAVARRSLTLRLLTSGRAAFDETRVAHVFSPVSGRVTRVLARFGETVRRGAALAAIDSPDLASAWADFAKARADLAAAERELSRQKGLFESHAGAQRDLEQAEDNAEKARAELERASLKLKLLHAPAEGGATQEFLLRAPIGGEVINRTATPGLEVQGMLSAANVVQELFTVGALDPIWIWGDVHEQDLGRVRKGQKVGITSVAYPGRDFSGAVDFVADVLDPQTHTARLRCAVANPGRLLKPEMFVSLAVETDRREALAIPRRSVVRSADHLVVLVDAGRSPDGRTRFLERVVRTGDSDDGWISVESGLAEGERIAVAGSILLTGESD